MAEEDDDAFTFGVFKSVPPQTQPLPINGGFSSTTLNADVWGDFFFSAPSQPNLSNASILSHHAPPKPSDNPKIPINFNLSGSFHGNPVHPIADPFPIRSDPGPNQLQKPKGAIPLSLFGEVEAEDETDSIGRNNANNKDSNGHNGKIGVHSDSNGIGFDNFDNIFGKLYVQNQQIKSEKGSDTNFEEEDEWEFKGANSDNGFMENNLEEKGHSLSSESKGEPVMEVNQEKQAGSFPGSNEIGNGNGMSANSVNEDDAFDDFDDFGDFVYASQEVQRGGQDQILPQMKTTEEEFLNNTIQDKQTKQENNGGALPLSLFSDLTEEPSDSLKYQDKLIQKPVSSPGNGFINQSPGISIHDLISNLYSQAQQTSSVDSSDRKPAVNDDWDDSSWEFKDAFSEMGVKEQSSSHTPGNVSQKPSETSSSVQFYVEFYATLREALCFLLSHQLKEEEEAPCSGSAIGDDGKTEAPGNDIQEAYKLLQDSMIDKEAFLKKHLEASTCLNEVLEALQDPKFKVIESQYCLSKRLQLAANEWRVASELLRQVISVLHILSLGSSDDHKVYVSTWSKLINICNEELKYGSLIWIRALEKNLQHQILSDHRGQRYIQALGEIYKVVELLGLSAKLYMPWMLLNVLPNFFGPLDECRTFWSSSGLERALQDMSDNVDFGCYEPAKELIASIKNIRDLEAHDLVFIQQKSLCRLSLLPLEMLADLKMVLWYEEPYFVNLVNLWANLISSNPPELPHLQVSQ